MIKQYADQVHRCFRCGYCKFPMDHSDFNCPSYARFRFDTYSTGGRLWLIYAWLKGEVEWSEHLAEILYACTTCKNCAEQCPMRFSTDIVDWIVAARSDIMEKEKGRLPPAVTAFLEDIYRLGNPLKSRERRDAWAKGIKRYQRGDEYLLYVGCLGSYDELGQKMAKSVAALLTGAGVSFGILGSEESCCGSEVYLLGENELFRLLAQRNIQKFTELGVKKVVTLSPHAYNTMKNSYPLLGGYFELYHYTQLLCRLLREGRLKPSPGRAKVTYHDPCFLGRYNRVYDEPREVLRAIPGLELVEMGRSRENSFCCGGGSGNFVTDLLSGSRDSPARLRVREAHKTGADILAVACPGCLTMLQDAVKVENLEGKVAVRDVSQVVAGG